jgi:hypothetical protein
MIRGWFTDIRWWPGQDGIRIREFGLAARISHSAPDSELAFSVGTAGGGIDGDTTGITDMQFITTTGTTREATRFITATLTTEEEPNAAVLMADVPALTRETGQATGVWAGEAESLTDPANRLGPSTEVHRRLEATLNPAAKMAPARAPSAATSMADRQEAIRHGGAPAWVVVEGREVAEDLAVAAAIGNEGRVNLLKGAKSELERVHMERKKQKFGNFHWAHIIELAAVAFILTACFPTYSAAQEQGQKTFSSAADATSALFTAARNNDEKAMLSILGPDGKQIVSSGDEVEDAHNRANFVKRYQEMHRLVREPDGTMVLYIGAENWPTPIPLVSKGDAWYFDTDAGKKEILYRRVGRNELSAIRVCQELVAAEKEYYSTQHNEFAQKFFSDEGQHNGLYWKAAGGEPQSPIGPLVASAVAEGYTKSKDDAPTPYRGYDYHILARQGKNGPGGAKAYIVSGKMTEGFAFVAYPAEYRSSGVMTFIVGGDGVVYEKDLGKKTENLAKAMTTYNPDSSWHKAEEQQQETAGEQKQK